MSSTELLLSATDGYVRAVFTPALTRAQAMDLHFYLIDAETRAEIAAVVCGAAEDWHLHAKAAFTGRSELN